MQFDNTYKSSTATRYMDRVLKEAIEIRFNRPEGCGSSPVWQPITKLLKQRKIGAQKEAIHPQSPIASHPLTSPGLIPLYIPHSLGVKLYQDPEGGETVGL